MPEKEKPGSEKALTPAQSLFQGQKSTKKRKKVQVLEQWIEVRIVDGQTVTTLYPSNQAVLERGKRMWPAPDLVYRRFNFPDGVPSEYKWVGLTEERSRLGGSGVQRMTTDSWLELIQKETEETPPGAYQSSIVRSHVGPTGVGNLPRPKDRGECECRVCERNQAILDLEAVQA